jgi:phage tail protein X
MVLKMVNPGIDDQFYIMPKTIEIVAIDLANLPKNLARTQYEYE